MAVIYATVVFQPAILWIYLQTMQMALVGAISWTTLILFVELTRLSGNPLTKQEAAVIYIGAIVSWTATWPMLFWIYALYLRHSPIALSFGLAQLIPDWYAPPFNSPVWDLRTFIHPSWVRPMTVYLISMILSLISNIATGLLTHRIYAREEKLPFPTQTMVATAITTLAEKEADRMRVFTTFTVISIIYCLFLYTIPFAAWSLGYEVRFIPVPWVDLNRYVNLIVRGASFGIGTDIAVMATGFIIPFNVSISMFIASFALQFVGNALLVNYHYTWFSEEWFFAMPIGDAWQRSILHAWASPLVGIALATGLVPLLLRRKIITQAFRSLLAAPMQAATILGGFLGATIGSTILTYYLVPDFPVWAIFLLCTGWSLVYVLMGSRVLGVAGVTFDVPSFPSGTPSNLVFLATGYTGTDIWFTSDFLVVEGSWGGPTWCGYLKIMDVCDADPLSIVKCWLAAYPIGVLSAFLYIQNFWRMAPIPSAVYPGPTIYWPVNAVLQSLWVKRALEIFNPVLVAGAFAITAVGYVVFEILKLPISMIGIAAGCASPIPITTSIFIGSIVGRIIEMRIGKEWWSKYKNMCAGGLALGEAIMAVVGSAIAIIVKSTWYMPY